MALTQVQGAMVGPTGFANLSGITFPATQVASADANTLDDYEEGTWTPSMVGSGGSSGQTYGTRAGRYVKIGKFVFVKCSITLSTAGTNSGSYAFITGFPFTAEATQNGMAMSPVAGYFANFATNIITFAGDMDPNTNYMYITYTTGTTGAPTFASSSFLASGCRVDFQACYEANA
jgi:hypothetical protein